MSCERSPLGYKVLYYLKQRKPTVARLNCLRLRTSRKLRLLFGAFQAQLAFCRVTPLLLKSGRSLQGIQPATTPGGLEVGVDLSTRHIGVTR